MNTLMTVPFHGANLMLVEHEGQPYVPMRPVVEGMGLSWQGQHAKLSSGRISSTIKEILIVAEDGRQREMICLPLRKLPGWMMSIHPNKVRPELRERIVAYQNECDDALWQYWNDGVAVNKRAVGGEEFAQGVFKEFQATQLELVQTVTHMTESSLKLAGLMGFEGNQGRFYADKVVRKQIGIGPLELLGVDSLPSSNEEVAYTPKQLGDRFGVAAPAFNKLLQKCGLQEPVPKGQGDLRWLPTPKGKPYAVIKDTFREHNSGAPVSQLRWKESVLDELRRASTELSLLIRPVAKG